MVKEQQGKQTEARLSFAMAAAAVSGTPPQDERETAERQRRCGEVKEGTEEGGKDWEVQDAFTNL